MARRKALKLSTPREVRRALARVANMLFNDELDPKQANALILACNAILGALRIDEQQARLEELEALVEDVQKDRN
jgi:hypothetical protein